jgi:hypothetical protein
MSGSGGGWGPSDHGDDGPKHGKPWGKGAPWYGKGGPQWGGKYGVPWSRREEIYGETVTVVVDRRTAENIYYALAIALGGVDWPESGDYWRGKSHKGRGKTPPDDGWSSKAWAASPWDTGPKGGGKGRRPKVGGQAPGPVTSPGPVRNPKAVTAVPVKVTVGTRLTGVTAAPAVPAVPIKATAVKPDRISLGAAIPAAAPSRTSQPAKPGRKAPPPKQKKAAKSKSKSKRRR